MDSSATYIPLHCCNNHRRQLGERQKDKTQKKFSRFHKQVQPTNNQNNHRIHGITFLHLTLLALKHIKMFRLRKLWAYDTIQAFSISHTRLPRYKPAHKMPLLCRNIHNPHQSHRRMNLSHSFHKMAGYPPVHIN